MANNYILGSGIVGLMAKLILGSSWTLIPFYKSRFFSFNPALDDNFVMFDDELEPFVKELLKTPTKPITYQYKRGWSIHGQLLRTYDSGLCNDWLAKIFGSNSPSHAELYYRNRMDVQVYDIRINQLWQLISNLFADEIKEQSAKSIITEIGDHYLVRDGIKEEFDQIISTIPLQALYKLIGHKHNLIAKPVHYYHIATKSLDFEGCNQQLVIDRAFSFYKVSNIAKDRYLFYCHEDIQQPGAYFMMFLGNDFEILDGTTIDNVLPLGNMPKLDWLEQRNIFCVGSYAQWDYCADVGSNVLRLLRFANRGNKAVGMKPLKV